MITVSDGITNVTLPDDIEWQDERAWQPVVQAAEFGITGALVVEAAAKLAGRPITLAGGDDRAWVARSVVDQLAIWHGIAGKQLTLNLRGVVRSVMFRHHEGNALEAKPVADVADPPADWPHVMTLRLMEI